MKSRFFLYCLLFCCAPLLFSCVQTAQQIAVPDRYRSPVIPKKWQDSPAIVLEHNTDVVFLVEDGGNRVTKKDTSWIYVNNKSRKGCEKVDIGWQKTLEEPVKITATAYYKDGTAWKLSDRDIESDKDPFSNSVMRSFLIPGYEKGVIIELVIEREYIQPEFFGRFLLADRFPIVSREISLQYPDDAELNYGVENPMNVDLETSSTAAGGRKTFRVKARDLAMFKEDYKTPYPEEYYTALHASFPPDGKRSYSWQELGDHYLGLMKNAFEITPAIRELGNTIASGSEGKNIISSSFDTVVKKVRYQGDWNGRFAFWPRKAEVVLENGYGDCKELTTILKALLKTKGIEAQFVLLSTWNHFQAIDKYPNLSNFNHAILAVPETDGSYHFLDATHSWADSTTSYFASIGRKAFIVGENRSHLSEIVPAQDFRNTVVTNSRLEKGSEDQMWHLDGTIDMHGYTALRFYEKLKYSDFYDEASFIKLYLHEYFDITAQTAELKSAGPQKVVLHYTAPFQENYIALGKGGFKLATPALNKSIVNNRRADLAGPIYWRLYEQSDRWQLPFSPANTKLHSIETALANGSWEVDGAVTTRSYRQKERKLRDQEGDIRLWYSKSRALTHSSVWR